jgi:hypothetical protein
MMQIPIRFFSFGVWIRIRLPKMMRIVKRQNVEIFLRNYKSQIQNLRSSRRIGITIHELC